MTSLSVHGPRHPGLWSTLRRFLRRTRTRPQADQLVITPIEVEQLTQMYADELARGWIPTEHDVRDALGVLRARDEERPSE